MAKVFSESDYERERTRAETMTKEFEHARKELDIAQRDVMVAQGKVQVLMDTIVELAVALRSRGIPTTAMPQEMYPGGQAFAGVRENEVPRGGVYDPRHSHVEVGPTHSMGVTDPGHMPDLPGVSRQIPGPPAPGHGAEMHASEDDLNEQY